MTAYDELLAKFPPPGLATVTEQALLVSASASIAMLQELEHICESGHRLVNMVERIAYPLSEVPEHEQGDGLR